jgi:hypothetical protein
MKLPAQTDLLLASLLLLACSVRLPFTPIFFIPLAAVSYWRLFRVREKKRLVLLARLCLFFLVLMASVGLQWQRVRQARTAATDTAIAIENWQRKTGHYPASLREGGLHAEPDRDQAFLHYALVNGEPFLMYSSAVNPYSRRIYNFRQHQWENGPSL